MDIIPGPDFPTGAVLILGRSGIYSAYLTGRGSVIMRGKVEIEQIKGDREAIIVTEIPYQAEQGLDDREDGRTGARQAHRGHFRHPRRIRPPGAIASWSSSKRDANADVILNQLYRFTPLQTSFGARHGRPEWRQARADEPARHAEGVRLVPRRCHQQAHQVPFCGRARERAHVLVGLAIAVANNRRESSGSSVARARPADRARAV